MSGITYDHDRKTATIVIDEFAGSVGAVGGSSTLQPNSQYLRLPAGAMLDLGNVLCDVHGVVRKRGTIKVSEVGAYDIVPTPTGSPQGAVLAALKFFNYGSTVTAGPYYAVTTGASPTAKYQSASGASVATSPDTSGVYPVSRVPTIAGGMLAVAGRYSGNGVSASVQARPQAVQLVAGTGTTYSTGTVTLTPGSASVVGAGTAWTSAHEGTFLVPTLNTAANYRAYQVERVVDGTHLLLSEPFLGSNSGSGWGYSLVTSATITTGTSTLSPWGVIASSGTGGAAMARVAAPAWGRLVLGWTREPEDVTKAYPLNDPVIGNSVQYKSRIRWSDIIGGEDGPDLANGPSVRGVYGWHVDGFLDLNTRYGGILAMIEYKGSLVVFQEAGLTIVYGNPLFDDATGLDATNTFDHVQINGGFAYEQTESGIVYVDKLRGPMLYDGSGAPQPLQNVTLALRDTLKVYDHVGYVAGHALFFREDISQSLVFWSYHMATGSWCRHTNSGTSGIVITHPQRSTGHECCALMRTQALGWRVVSLDSFAFPDGTVGDTDGTTTYTVPVTIQTGHFGSPTERLRAQSCYVTLRATGTPATTVTLRAGLPVTQDSAHQEAVIVRTTATGTSGADIETMVLDGLQMNPDNTMSVKITDTGDALGHFELVEVVIECTVEGRGPSS